MDGDAVESRFEASLQFFSGSRHFPTKEEVLDNESILPTLHKLRLEGFHSDYTIPPTSSNTLHTLVLVNYFASSAQPFQLPDLVRHHAESLRRISINQAAYGIEPVPVFDEIAALAHKVEYLHIINTPQISPTIFERIPTYAVQVTLSFHTTTFTGEACLELLHREVHGRLPLKLLNISVIPTFDFTIIPEEEDWGIVCAAAESLGVRFHFEFHTGDIQWSVGVHKMPDIFWAAP
jgi:hypothetical protein